MLSEEQQNFVARQRVAHLATADGEGSPHVMPVCFVQHENCFYIAVDEKPKRTSRLRRLRNLEANPQVCLLFDKYDEDWSRLGWVMVEGTAEVLIMDQSRAHILAQMRARYPQYADMQLEGRPLIQVRPLRVQSWGDLSS